MMLLLALIYSQYWLYCYLRAVIDSVIPRISAVCGKPLLSSSRGAAKKDVTLTFSIIRRLFSIRAIRISTRSIKILAARVAIAEPKNIRLINYPEFTVTSKFRIIKTLNIKMAIAQAACKAACLAINILFFLVFSSSYKS